MEKFNAIIMFILTTFLFLMITLFYSYDSRTTMLNYINKYDINYAYLGTKSEYTDLFLEKNINVVYKGKNLYDNLHNSFSKREILNELTHLSLSNTNFCLNNQEDLCKEVYGINAMVSSNNFEILGLSIEGDYPVSKDQIVITDYIAKLLDIENNPLGQTVYYNDYEFIVVGVIKTDYEEYNIFSKINTDLYTDYGAYKVDTEYQMVLLNQRYIDFLRTNNDILNLKRSDFTRSNRLSHYLESELRYGSLDMYDETIDELSWGRLPKNENEVLVSTEFLRYVGIDDSSFQTREYQYINLYDSVYNGFYFDGINFYDFFKNGIKIVGVYDNLNNPNLSDWPEILIDSRKWQDMNEIYFHTYIYNRYRVIINNPKDFVEKIYDNNLHFNEPNVQTIYDFEDQINYYSKYLFFVMIIFSLITLFMIITLISFSVKENYRKIGILRSIGVKRQDTLKIFMIEALLLNLIGVTGAIICSIISINYINKVFKLTLIERKFNIMFPNWYSIIILSVFIFIVSLLAAILPVLKFSKQKPIDVIRAK